MSLACQLIIIMKIDLKLTTLLVLLCVSFCQVDMDAGAKRLQELRLRSQNSSNRIINFTKTDYDNYVTRYPRPYDVVIYFDAKNCPFCEEIFPEMEYLVDLYREAGAIDNHTYPTFFARMTFVPDMRTIFTELEFDTAPNLLVSKPHMAVVSKLERPSYLKQFKWKITHTDGHVTTHKILEFVNKRTKKDISYKPTPQTVQNFVLGFIGAALAGVIIYRFLKVIWNHWLFWLLGSLAVYIVCCSGIVYCIIHDVPFQGRSQNGEEVIFSDGSREQYGLEGWVISAGVTLVGLLFIAIAVTGEKCRQRYSLIVGIVSLIAIYYLVTLIEAIYKKKGWYGPSFFPPSEYLRGPLSVDQGNNI